MKEALRKTESVDDADTRMGRKRFRAAVVSFTLGIWKLKRPCVRIPTTQMETGSSAQKEKMPKGEIWDPRASRKHLCVEDTGIEANGAFPCFLLPFYLGD